MDDETNRSLTERLRKFIGIFKSDDNDRNVGVDMLDVKRHGRTGDQMIFGGAASINNPATNNISHNGVKAQSVLPRMLFLHGYKSNEKISRLQADNLGLNSKFDITYINGPFASDQPAAEQREMLSILVEGPFYSWYDVPEDDITTAEEEDQEKSDEQTESERSSDFEERSLEALLKSLKYVLSHIDKMQMRQAKENENSRLTSPYYDAVFGFSQGAVIATVLNQKDLVEAIRSQYNTEFRLRMPSVEFIQKCIALEEFEVPPLRDVNILCTTGQDTTNVGNTKRRGSFTFGDSLSNLGEKTKISHISEHLDVQTDVSRQFTEMMTSPKSRLTLLQSTSKSVRNAFETKLIEDSTKSKLVNAKCVLRNKQGFEVDEDEWNRRRLWHFSFLACHGNVAIINRLRFKLLPVLDIESEGCCTSDTNYKLGSIHFVGLLDQRKGFADEALQKYYDLDRALPIYLDSAHDIPTFRSKVRKSLILFEAYAWFMKSRLYWSLDASFHQKPDQLFDMTAAYEDLDFQEADHAYDYAFNHEETPLLYCVAEIQKSRCLTKDFVSVKSFSSASSVSSTNGEDEDEQDYDGIDPSTTKIPKIGRYGQYVLKWKSPAKTTLLSILREEKPSRPALFAPEIDTPITYKDLCTFVNEEGDLRWVGANAKSIVAYIAPPGIVGATAFLCISCQCAAAPLESSLSTEDFIQALNQIQPDLIVIFEGCRNADVHKEVSDSLGFLTVVATCDGRGCFTFQKKVDKVSHLRLKTSCNDVALILRTSGSTSQPKLCPIKMGALVSNAKAIANHFCLKPNDVSLNAMPLSHIGGISSNLLSAICSGGSAIVIMEFKANEFLSILTQSAYKHLPFPSWYSAVPTMHSAICDVAAQDRNMTSKHRLQFIRSGAAALSQDLSERIKVLFKCPIISTYSMTEQMPIAQMPFKRKMNVTNQAGAIHSFDPNKQKNLSSDSRSKNLEEIKRGLKTSESAFLTEYRKRKNNNAGELSGPTRDSGRFKSILRLSKAPSDSLQSSLMESEVDGSSCSVRSEVPIGSWFKKNVRARGRKADGEFSLDAFRRQNFSSHKHRQNMAQSEHINLKLFKNGGSFHESGFLRTFKKGGSFHESSFMKAFKKGGSFHESGFVKAFEKNGSTHECNVSKAVKNAENIQDSSVMKTVHEQNTNLQPTLPELHRQYSLDGTSRVLSESRLYRMKHGFSSHESNFMKGFSRSHRIGSKVLASKSLSSSCSSSRSDWVTRSESDFERRSPVTMSKSFLSTSMHHLRNSRMNVAAKKAKKCSVGTVSCASIYIADEMLRPVQTGKKGEVCVSSPSVIDEYVRDPASNMKSFFIFAGMKWFRTGDLGYLDEKSHLHLTGRKKEIIKRGGEQISPFEVEHALALNDSIEFALVFGIPCPFWGQRVGAAVVLKDKNILQEDGATLERNLKSFLANDIGLQSYKIPEKIVSVNAKDLPMTRSKKYTRVGLSKHLNIQIDDEESDFANLKPVKLHKSLIGVRFILACWVFFNHVGQFGHGWEYSRSFCLHPPAFFFLGGILLAASTNVPVVDDLANFFSIRLAVLHPMYVLSVILLAATFSIRCNPSNYNSEFEFDRQPNADEDFVCQASLVEMQWGMTMFISLVTHLFGIQTWPFAIPFQWFISMYAWFSSVYIFCVCVFPWIHNSFYKDRKSLKKIVLQVLKWIVAHYVVVATFLFNWIFDKDSQMGQLFGICAYLFPVGWLPTFAIGIGAYFIFSAMAPNEKLSAWKWGVLTDFLSFVILAIFIWYGTDKDSASPADDERDWRIWAYFMSRLCSPICFIWLYGLAVGKGVTANILANDILVVYLAPASYNIYLFHQFVYEWYWFFTRNYWWSKPKSFFWFSPLPTPVPYWEFFIVLFITVGLSLVLEYKVNTHLVTWFANLAQRFYGKDTFIIHGIMDEDIESVVKYVIADVTGVDPMSITPSSTLMETGCSSMTCPIILSKMKRHYKFLSLSYRDLFQVETIEDLAKLVKKRLEKVATRGNGFHLS